MSRLWIKVEFYGAMPEGRDVETVDLTQVEANLARIFGFEFIDGLVIQRSPA
jgi:hypothetical protein